MDTGCAEEGEGATGCAEAGEGATGLAEGEEGAIGCVEGGEGAIGCAEDAEVGRFDGLLARAKGVEWGDWEAAVRAWARCARRGVVGTGCTEEGEGVMSCVEGGEGAMGCTDDAGVGRFDGLLVRAKGVEHGDWEATVGCAEDGIRCAEGV